MGGGGSRQALEQEREKARDKERETLQLELKTKEVDRIKAQAAYDALLGQTTAEDRQVALVQGKAEAAKKMAETEMVQLSRKWRKELRVEQAEGRVGLSRDRVQMLAEAYESAKSLHLDARAKLDSAAEESACEHAAALRTAEASSAAQLAREEAFAVVQGLKLITATRRTAERSAAESAVTAASNETLARQQGESIQVALDAAELSVQEKTETHAAAQRALDAAQAVLSTANQRQQQQQIEIEQLRAAVEASKHYAMAAKSSLAEHEENIEQGEKALTAAQAQLEERMHLHESQVAKEASAKSTQLAHEPPVAEAERVEANAHTEFNRAKLLAVEDESRFTQAREELRAEVDEQTQRDSRNAAQAMRGDAMSALEAAAHAAARALLEIIPHRDPGGTPQPSQPPPPPQAELPKVAPYESSPVINFTADAEGEDEEPETPASPPVEVIAPLLVQRRAPQDTTWTIESVLESEAGLGALRQSTSRTLPLPITPPHPTLLHPDPTQAAPLHSTLYTLHSTPCTLHSILCTLTSIHSTLRSISPHPILLHSIPILYHPSPLYSIPYYAPTVTVNSIPPLFSRTPPLSPPPTRAPTLTPTLRVYEDALLAFCESEYNAENLHFVVAVRVWKRDWSKMDANARMEMSEGIVEKFLATGAPEEVCADALATAPTLVEHSGLTMFDQPYQVALNALKLDIWGRFEDTQEGLSLRSQLANS